MNCELTISDEIDYLHSHILNNLGFETPFQEVGSGQRDEYAEHRKYCENTEYDTVIMDICYYTFVQTYRICNTKNELHRALSGYDI